LDGAKVESIEEYIRRFPEPVRERMEKIRRVVAEAAPGATEAISYGIPTFKLNGNLVHFGAFKDHIGFFPTSSGVAAFATEFSGYKQSRGTVQFPHTKPIPYELVGRVVRFRVEQQLGKGKRTRSD